MLGVATLVVLAVACSADPGSSRRDELLVFAAASLADPFRQMVRSFEAVEPGMEVLLNLEGSSLLREQVLEGAPADVFASADASNMDRVVEAGANASEPVLFVTNVLQIAVPADNPGGVTGLDDFADEDLLIGLCSEGVPCGDLGREALASAGVTPAVDSNEPDVRALLTKIETGELDAGITYATDVLSADGAVLGIDIPAEHNVVASYPIVALAGPNPAGAAAFVSFVLSSEGGAIMAAHGFGTP